MLSIFSTLGSNGSGGVEAEAWKTFAGLLEEEPGRRFP